MKPDPIEDLRLRAYPNAERKGCPGTEVTRALANKEIPAYDSRWQHLWHCSPCFSEFKVIRDERLARESAKLRVFALTAAAVVLVVALVGFAFRLMTASGWRRVDPAISQDKNPVRELKVEVLDFRASTSRGITPGAKPRERLVSTSVKKLQVLLPAGSPIGEYTVQISKQSDVEARLMTYKASAYAGLDRTTRLQTEVDFSSLPPGRYIFAWQRAGAESRNLEAFSIRESVPH